ncbi:hypothetical protein TSOC_008955, partial [Tetrabaena socialis]
VYTLGGRTGRLSSEVVSSNSLEEFDPRGRSVRTQLLSGWQNVSARAGHTMVEWVDGSGRRHLVVFGGAGYQATSEDADSTGGAGEVPSGPLLADVASVDVLEAEWSMHNNTGAGPSPRKFASAAVWRGDVMLVYGGLTNDGSASSELWAYNLTSRR